MKIKEVYNLVILDRSGSMSSIRRQAIGGVNETIGTIRSAERLNDQKQYLTVTLFCGCTINDFCTATSIDDVREFTQADFDPCCMTPLYDAIGASCTKLMKSVAGRDDVAVSVTIITDGYENASREWTGPAVKSLIESLKSQGWLFAFIGANQDSLFVSSSLGINNSLNFEATPEGSQAMFAKQNASRSRWFSKLSSVCSCMADEADSINSDYFDDKDLPY